MTLRSFALPLFLLVCATATVAWLKLVPPPAAPEPAPPPAAQPVQDLPPAGPAQPLVAGRLQDGTAQEASAMPAAAAPLPQTLRNVSPEGIAMPSVLGTLKRVEAVLPKLEQPKTALAESGGPVIVLRRPQVPFAGVLTGNGLTLHLAYVSALPPSATCPAAEGPDWPCGARARTALRAVVRLYAVTCHKLEDLAERTLIATCKRGTLDLSQWLVRYGWATPTADAPDAFAGLAEAARAANKGQWQRVWEPLPVGAREADGTSSAEAVTGAAFDELLPAGDTLTDLERLPSRRLLPALGSGTEAAPEAGTGLEAELGTGSGIAGTGSR